MGGMDMASTMRQLQFAGEIAGRPLALRTALSNRAVSAAAGRFDLDDRARLNLD
jgi:hypothetical protein